MCLQSHGCSRSLSSERILHLKVGVSDIEGIWPCIHGEQHHGGKREACPPQEIPSSGKHSMLIDMWISGDNCSCDSVQVGNGTNRKTLKWSLQAGKNHIIIIIAYPSLSSCRCMQGQPKTYCKLAFAKHNWRSSLIFVSTSSLHLRQSNCLDQGPRSLSC